MKYSLKKHKGIGLIEVLITTLVVALGLLAVASLQGNLMSVSGSNKASSEAKSLCENRLEQVRDAATKGLNSSITAGEYSAIGMVSPAVVTGTAPTRTGVTTETGLTGTNETFTRVTTVTELTNPIRKQIDVTCTWGNADSDHSVVVQSILGFDSLGAAIKVAKTAGASLGNPSTNAGSSTEIHDSTTVQLTTAGTAGTLSSQTTWTGKEDGQYLKINTGGTTGTVVYKCTGGTFITFDAAKGLYTRRVANPNTTSSFVATIELAKSNNDTLFESGTVSSCTRKIRYNGGIMLPIRGAVYSKTSSRSSIIDINLFTFDASESGIYCAFTPASNSTQAPYVCYAGGNCANGPVGTHVTTDGITITTGSTGNAVVTECPTATAPSDAYETVGAGGWRGEVGLLGIPTSNAAHNNVCFAEEVAANPAILNTARNYFTRRFTNSAARNEGINKPYACHDFLIIDGKNTEAAVHTECADQVGTLKLASKNIMRDFTAASTLISPLNDVDLTISKSSCHIITGTVTSGMTTVQATSTSGYFDCSVNTSSNTYECYGTAIGVNTGTTNSPIYAASVLLKEGTMVSNAFSAGTRSCTTTLLTSNTNLTCNIAGAAATRNIAVTVSNATGTTGTTAVTSVLDNSTTPAFTCVLSTGATYNCTALTTWAGTIKALSTCNNVAVADAVTTSVAAGTTNTTATITLPSCAASTTHNLVVTVNKAGLGTSEVTGVTTSGGVTCTLTTGTTYNCLVLNSWTGTATATSTCNAGAAISTTSASISLNAATATVNLPSCAAVNYTLTVTAPTNGAIKDSLTTPVNINCGSTCTHNYTSGTGVNLYAIPNTGYGVLSWTNCDIVNSDKSCSMSLTANKSGVTATFTPVYTLTTSVTPTSTGTISPATGVYNSGAVVAVTATPNAGYKFSSWSGDCTGTGTCSVTMSAAKSVTATFVQTRTVSVSVANGASVTALSSSGATCSTSSCTNVSTGATTMSVTLAAKCTPTKRYRYSVNRATAVEITATTFTVTIPAGTTAVTIAIDQDSTNC